MKTRLLPVLASGIALTAAFFLNGCAEQPTINKVAATPTNAVVATAATETNRVEKAEPVRQIALQPRTVSPGVASIVELAQSGVGNEVIAAYVGTSSNRYALTSDDIVYLNDLGVSSEVITAMLQRKLNEADAVAAVPATPSPSTAPAQLPPAQTAVAAGQPLGTPPAGYYQVDNPAPPTEQVAPQIVVSPVVVNRPVSENYFYSYLAPYGSWMEVPGTGWCWQPSTVVVDPGWQPYCQRGRWLSSDHGWYWQSDYSWGWAPFHYGRWTRHATCGWLWVPDTTWGPAWVTWRSHDSYCGWAPLPPGCDYRAGIGLTFHGSHVGAGFSFGLGADWFTFVSYRNFPHHNPAQFRLGAHEARGVFARATVINNYTYNDHRVINVGVPPERIAAVTRHELPRVNVVDAGTPKVGIPPRREVLDHASQQLGVHRLPASTFETPRTVVATAAPMTPPPARTFAERPANVAGTPASPTTIAPQVRGVGPSPGRETGPRSTLPMYGSSRQNPRPTAIESAPQAAPAPSVSQYQPGVIRQYPGMNASQAVAPRIAANNNPVYPAAPTASVSPQPAPPAQNNFRQPVANTYGGTPIAPANRNAYSAPGFPAAPNYQTEGSRATYNNNRNAQLESSSRGQGRAAQNESTATYSSPAPRSAAPVYIGPAASRGAVQTAPAPVYSAPSAPAQSVQHSAPAPTPAPAQSQTQAQQNNSSSSQGQTSFGRGR